MSSPAQRARFQGPALDESKAAQGGFRDGISAIRLGCAFCCRLAAWNPLCFMASRKSFSINIEGLW